jgi:hypothetical protein
MSDSQVTGINYFDHQFLRQTDFITAQNYHIARLQQHNQLLHRPGVVGDGLNVTKTGDRSVQLSLGRAVDKNYREVILSQDAPPLLRIQTAGTDFRESEPTLTAQGLQLDLSSIPSSAAPIYLTIGQDPKPTTPSSDPGTTGQFTRLIERPVIEASTVDPGTAKLILAILTRNTSGIIDNTIDFSRRELANATLAPNSVSESNLNAATRGKLVNNGSSLTITGDLNAAGNMGIGTQPTQKLDVNGTINATEYFKGGVKFAVGSQWTDVAGVGITYLGGNVGIKIANPRWELEVNGEARKPGGGSWGDSSDIRLKQNVQPLIGSLEKLLRLRGVTYEWKEPEHHGNLTGTQIGMIGQEVETIFPQWVSTDSDGYKTLTFRGFEALTVEAMKELKAENTALKQLIHKLENRVAVLEEQLRKIPLSS